MRMRRGLAALPSMLLAALALLIGCSSNPGLEYIPSGGTYTMQQAQQVAAAISLDSVEGIKTSNASVLRTERLRQLRSEGPAASDLADALTKDFPSDTSAVPLRVEAATVDGVKVWIVIEAWGDDLGTLEHRRLWVMDRTSLGIVGSSSFR